MSRVLVAGARANSLGSHVTRELRELGYDVRTCGIFDEECFVNMRDKHSVHELLKDAYDHVVCTIGINASKDEYATGEDWVMDHMRVNSFYPMRLLHSWLKTIDVPNNGHFVAISSNSAFIPRRHSMAYCASKAALSMSIRVAAREEAVGQRRAIIYGYEPGLIVGTPMTDATVDRFGPYQTRIPGQPHGLAADAVAAQIAATLHVGGWGLNGTLQRLDGGEQ